MNRSQTTTPRNSRSTGQSTRQSTSQGRTQRGLTLIECVVTLAIIVITLGAAIPSFTEARERRQLEGAAAQLATDIRHARSLAVSQAIPIRLRVQQTVDGSCYVVHSGPAGHCSCTSQGTAQCSPDARAFQSVGFDARGALQVASNSSSMMFDPNRGTVTPTGTLRVQLQRGQALHQVVNIMGRVRACSPAGAVPGYPAC